MTVENTAGKRNAKPVRLRKDSLDLKDIIRFLKNLKIHRLEIIKSRGKRKERLDIDIRGTDDYGQERKDSERPLDLRARLALPCRFKELE